MLNASLQFAFSIINVYDKDAKFGFLQIVC